LNSPEAETVVAGAVRRGVREYFEANHEVAERVVSAVVLARDVRVAAMAARKELRKRGGE
jgi:DNA gyrase/topoisomerase IV subunit B